MIDLGRETDGYNENCLGVRFALCIIWIFLWNFHRRCLSTSSIPWCKKVKNDQTSNQGGPALSYKTNWSAPRHGNSSPQCDSWELSTVQAEDIWISQCKFSWVRAPSCNLLLSRTNTKKNKTNFPDSLPDLLWKPQTNFKFSPCPILRFCRRAWTLRTWRPHRRSVSSRCWWPRDGVGLLRRVRRWSSASTAREWEHLGKVGGGGGVKGARWYASSKSRMKTLLECP